MGLKSGTLCTVWQKNEGISIRGRKLPQAISSPRGVRPEDIVVCTVPAGAQVLYMCSQADSFNAALRGKGKGPYGFTPVQLHYHFVLWEGRPIWLASGDCELRPC